jgi:hypothetical protein
MPSPDFPPSVSEVTVLCGVRVDDTAMRANTITVGDRERSMYGPLNMIFAQYTMIDA